MKKLSLFFLSFCLISLPAIARETNEKRPSTQPTQAQPAAPKEAKDSNEPKPGGADEPAAGMMSKKDIAAGMSQAWCGKMDECAGEKKIPLKDCEKQLFKSFKDGFDNLPKGQAINVKPDSFEQCKQSIQAGTCDSLKAAQALPGCDFISLLNRQ